MMLHFDDDGLPRDAPGWFAMVTLLAGRIAPTDPDHGEDKSPIDTLPARLLACPDWFWE
jgi:hypothetical protein